MNHLSQRYRQATALWVAIFAVVFVWSAVNPHDRLTWWMEVLPAIIAIFILGTLYPRYKMTNLAYWLILAHCLVLMVGGHYTYALVPAGNWVKEAFDLGRNHYDRLGHLFQGFVPALLAREVLARHTPLKPGKWLGFLSICFALAFSAFYELIEWWSALGYGADAEAFLATQGDPWDTQKDMFMALIGACLSMGLLSGWHNRQLDQVTGQRRWNW